jgi:hypothetical protein
MKLGWIFTLLFLTIAGVSQARENHAQIGNQTKIDSVQTESKTYIDSDKVLFGDKEIYVCLNQNWVRTNAIFSDASGFYIVNDKGGWTCSFCGYYNTTSLRYCDSCNRER